MKKALMVISSFYLSSLAFGLLVAYFFPEYSQGFVDFASRGTVAGAWITPFLETKNPLMIGLSIFIINFVLGTFIRFVLAPILLYHVAFILGALVGFFMGFIVGSPQFLSLFMNFPSFGALLLILTIIFENLGYITACATGYKIAKESQEGLTRKQFLKLLIVPIHLKDVGRRETIRRSLSASTPWILLSMTFIVAGTLFETLLIVYFR